MTEPLKPALQRQPETRSAPELLTGQPAGEQEPVKPLEVKVMVPEKPASQMQAPLLLEELAGQEAGAQVPE